MQKDGYDVILMGGGATSGFTIGLLVGGTGEPAIEVVTGWRARGDRGIGRHSFLPSHPPSKKFPLKAGPHRLKIPPTSEYRSLNLIHTSSTHDRAHPPDSMHRCLNVDEILRLIAYELVASETEATAVCMARCCKCFQGPVLDTLWAEQFDLSPLFKCFPGDVWNEGGYKVSVPTTWVCFFLH